MDTSYLNKMNEQYVPGVGASNAGPWYQKALSGASNFISQKPEMFAMFADKLGSGIAPNNPMAGLGTALAKSSIADKAEKERKSQADRIMDLIKGLTGPEKPGGNKLSFSVDKNGNLLTNVVTQSKLDKMVNTEPIRALEEGAAQSNPFSVLEDLERQALGGR